MWAGYKSETITNFLPFMNVYRNQYFHDLLWTDLEVTLGNLRGGRFKTSKTSVSCGKNKETMGNILKSPGDTGL